MWKEASMKMFLIWHKEIVSKKIFKEMNLSDLASVHQWSVTKQNLTAAHMLEIEYMKHQNQTVHVKTMHSWTRYFLYLHFLGTYDKLFLLEGVSVQTVEIHFHYKNCVKIWYFGDLLCIAFLGYTYLVRALKMCPRIVIDKNQILGCDVTLALEYLCMKSQVSSILNHKFWEQIK